MAKLLTTVVKLQLVPLLTESSNAYPRPYYSRTAVFAPNVNAKSLSLKMLFNVHAPRCFHGQADERIGLSSGGFVDPNLMELAGWMDSIEARSPVLPGQGSVRQSPYCAMSA